MQEIALYAVPVAVFMLAVPLCHSISECRQGRSVQQIRVHRWWIMCTFMLFFSLFSAIVFGFAGIFISRLPVRQIRHSAQCKVISKDVDLRSAKACGFGDFSPLSLKMFGIPDTSKFQCSLDYYWISVFKVEFKPYDSSIATQVMVELPTEVLPSSCRPGFAVVWRTTENLEVNSTYQCLYSAGKIHLIDMAGFRFQRSDCTPEKPSSLKLFRDYLVLVISSYNLKQSTPIGNLFWKGIYAVLIGLAYTIIVTAVTKAICWFHFKVLDPGNSSFINVVFFEARFQISCLVLALTIGIVLSTSDFEELRSEVQLLTGLNLETQILKNWLDKIRIFD